jgi:hypothetical protein
MQDLLGPTKVHPSHTMVFRPCLFLECDTCMISAAKGAPELEEPCRGSDFSFTLNL